MNEKEFPTKYMKKIKDLPGFVDGVETDDADALKKRILVAEEHLWAIEQDKETNEKLKEAKDVAKELTRPYAEAKGIEMAKIKYCLYVLEGRGVRV